MSRSIWLILAATLAMALVGCSGGTINPGTGASTNPISVPSVAGIVETRTGVATLIQTADGVILTNGSSVTNLGTSTVSSIPGPGKGGIVITPGKGTVDTGASTSFLVIVLTKDGKIGNDARWVSSNPAIARVSSQGSVTGVSPGTVTIVATSTEDSTLSAGVPVTVRAGTGSPVISSVNLTAPARSLPIGSKLTLIAAVILSDGTTSAATSGLTYASTDNKIATVNTSGVVTGISQGTVAISARSTLDPGQISSLSLQVTAAQTASTAATTVQTVTVTPPSPSIQIGVQQIMSASVQLSDGTADPTQPSVTWSSSDTSKATVTSTGIVTALAAGNVTVRATSTRDNAKFGTTSVTIPTPITTPSPTPATTQAPTPTPTSSSSITQSGTVLGTFTVGTGPLYLAIDSSSNVWVTDAVSNNVMKLSSAGTSLGTFMVGSGPYGIAIDVSGNVWVSNSGSNSVTKLSSTGSALGTYSVGSAPYGIATDSSGNAWVSIGGGNNVLELNSAGTSLGPYQVGALPVGIAIDSGGNTWVVNAYGNSVTKLSSAGTSLGTFPVGTLPYGIAIDGSGNVWVTNFSSNTVTKLTSTGTNLGTFPVGTNPEGVAVDNSGNAWVANANSNNVTKLSPSGTNLGTYSVGTQPYGIAIDRNNPFVWVANYASNNVTKLSTGGALGTL